MEINSHTQLCGVIGNPVEHSLSPAIHNAAFQHLALNYVYLAFRVEDLPAAVQGIRALGNVRGFSVTIPHKVTIIPYLDDVDPVARNIGSVNTLVREDGKLAGSNTDAEGAVRALKEGGINLKDQRVLLLGSGGAARAIAFGLAEESVAELVMLGIDEAERRALVEDLRARTSLPIDEGPLTENQLQRHLEGAHILIHCTPVGMHPRVDESCVPAHVLRPSLSVMDIVYNPQETRLLKEARQAGCRTIPGLEMFLHQAVAQFERWTGRAAPVEVMRRVLEGKLQ